MSNTNTAASNRKPSRKPLARPEFVAALAAHGFTDRNLWARLDALGMLTECGRCGGCGRYSWNAITGDKCFGCNGSGKALPKFSAALVAEVSAKVEAGGLVAYLANVARKAAAKRALRPLMVEAEAAYSRTADRYTAVDRKAPDYDVAALVRSPIFHAQTLANACFWGHENRAVSPAGAGVKDIEAMAARGELDPEVAVALVTERIEFLHAIANAFEAL